MRIQYAHMNDLALRVQRVMAAITRRKPLNVSIPEDLAAAARRLGVNASQAAADGISAAVKRAEESRWLEANRAAIEAHTAWLEENGMPLEPAWPE